MINIKKKTPIIGLVIIAGMIMFGKYALIFLGIAVFIILICLAVSYENNKSSKNQYVSKSSSGLNYKPLSKNEISNLKPQIQTDVKTVPMPVAQPVASTPKETPYSCKYKLQEQILPLQVDNLSVSYCYVAVRVCIIKDRAPDMDMLRKNLSYDSSITVEAEPTNPYDDEAVALYSSERIHIGYLYRSALKDMAYNYLLQNLPIRAYVCILTSNDIYINIAFYSDKYKIIQKENSAPLKYSNQIIFTLDSSDENIQEMLGFSDVDNEVEFEYDIVAEKYVFLDNYCEIGYAPEKYDGILGLIDNNEYDAIITKINESSNGKLSAEIKILF